jgi:hypothetical protein
MSLARLLALQLFYMHTPAELLRTSHALIFGGSVCPAQ